MDKAIQGSRQALAGSRQRLEQTDRRQGVGAVYLQGAGKASGGLMKLTSAQGDDAFEDDIKRDFSASNQTGGVMGGLFQPAGLQGGMHQPPKRGQPSLWFGQRQPTQGYGRVKVLPSRSRFHVLQRPTLDWSR
ncbi:hypothetical protein [Nitrospirillum amazonense]|uniref:hypothetical protein n=1 Tax=Nitrospirillum amazonense TaxID=28077 RepID=UPI001645C90F|nr:hypothetical protein [Nitrospirillum amazonense]